MRSDFREALAYLRLSLIDIFVHSFSKHSDNDQGHLEMELECEYVLFCSLKS